MALTTEEARRDFDRKGVVIAQWAREHQVSPMAVYHALAGRTSGRRGQAHKVCVLLGLKDGEITDEKNSSHQPSAKGAT